MPLLLAALLAGALFTTTTAHARRHIARADPVERQIVRLINRTRAGYGERRLDISRRMNGGADAYSRHLARTGYFAHGAWDRRIRRSSGSSRVGEVLAYLSGHPAGGQARWVVSAWLQSATHRAVLLNGSFRRVGVARRRGGGRTWFTVDVAG